MSFLLCPGGGGDSSARACPVPLRTGTGVLPQESRLLLPVCERRWCLDRFLVGVGGETVIWLVVYGVKSLPVRFPTHGPSQTFVDLNLPVVVSYVCSGVLLSRILVSSSVCGGSALAFVSVRVFGGGVFVEQSARVSEALWYLGLLWSSGLLGFLRPSPVWDWFGPVLC
ncbi:unnamed protein product [Eruca vesicaria subsp. sativa]|uniref:Uncharacterized protein n=1 Tax=Eruca vesicaria subsp. sativa TaxID=29727 RepID=A0ABC8LW15_ERUVS|nr:unnamed protein product [Eruca vesicaria subsp. sativa]